MASRAGRGRTGFGENIITSWAGEYVLVLDSDSTSPLLAYLILIQDLWVLHRTKRIQQQRSTLVSSNKYPDPAHDDGILMAGRTHCMFLAPSRFSLQVYGERPSFWPRCAVHGLRIQL